MVSRIGADTRLQLVSILFPSLGFFVYGFVLVLVCDPLALGQL